MAENQWEVEVQHMEQENYERSVKMEAELSRCNKIIAELEQEVSGCYYTSDNCVLRFINITKLLGRQISR